MTAVLAVGILAAGSPAWAALEPSTDSRVGMAVVLTPMPIAERHVVARGEPSATFIPKTRPSTAEDAAEAERRNFLLAPPADEAVHLYVAAAAGLVVIGLMMLAMLIRKPTGNPPADA